MLASGPALRRELDCTHLGTFTGEAATFWQRIELSKRARDLLAKLGAEPSRKILELIPAT